MIVIIGAGISGLSLAYFLQKNNIAYQVIESNQRSGGNIVSKKIGDYLLELGPNSFLGGTKIFELIRDLKIEDQVLWTQSVSKNRFIFKNGRYRALSMNPLLFFTNSFFSWKTKIAILKEPFKQKQKVKDETVSAFFQRRFSKEIVDYAVNPFVSGIYAGDPDRLILEDTFPTLYESEQKYGSVLKGFFKNKSNERKKSFSFINGMQTLTDAISRELKALSLNESVEKIQRHKNNWIIRTSKKEYRANQLVMALPAYKAAELLALDYSEMADSFKNIYYPPMTVIHSSYKKEHVKHSLNGFGGLNPALEQQFSLGSIWTSSVFKNRCPEDSVLFTTFVGGSMHPELTQLPDFEIQEKVHLELSKNFEIYGQPVFQHVHKWDKAIPQYDQSYHLTIHQMAAFEKDQLFFCNNWNKGVSLNDCFTKAQLLANDLAKDV